MEALSHFKTLDDLVKCINREKDMLSKAFSDRKTHSFTSELAMELVEYKRERIQYLIDHGVIHESGNFLELEDVYLRFFEDVLDVNEEINIASVKECIEALKENIIYYQKETTEKRKYHYLSILQRKLRDIGLRTIRNVIDLKRNVDIAYKQEPNYDIKIQKLQNLDEKRKSIRVLIDACERLLEEDKAFFLFTSNPQMVSTIANMRTDFTDAYHNLLSIESQIIEYIHLIEQQNLLIKKIRKLKYLRDQLTIKQCTNILPVVSSMNPIWMENRPYNKLRLSLELLQGSEDMSALIRKVAKREGIIRKSRISASPLTNEELQESTSLMNEVNQQEMWRAFRAGSNDLFSFILAYNYKHEKTIEQHAVLFCQLAVQHPEECRITDKYETYQNLEYPLIYAK
jgi:hypothetical protein